MNTLSLHTNVHPVFAGILQAIEQSPEVIARAQYVARLVKMDWQFEHAPHAQWCKGRDELLALRALQAKLDPTATLWNKHCHADFRKLS